MLALPWERQLKKPGPHSPRDRTFVLPREPLAYSSAREPGDSLDPPRVSSSPRSLGTRPHAFPPGPGSAWSPNPCLQAWSAPRHGLQTSAETSRRNAPQEPRAVLRRRKSRKIRCLHHHIHQSRLQEVLRSRKRMWWPVSPQPLRTSPRHSPLALLRSYRQIPSRGTLLASLKEMSGVLPRPPRAERESQPADR